MRVVGRWNGTKPNLPADDYPHIASTDTGATPHGAGYTNLCFYFADLSPSYRMTRAKAQDKKRAVGRKTDFSDAKVSQLAQFAQLFRDAQDTTTRSSFYHQLTLWCVTHWGYDVNELGRDGPDIELDDEPNLRVDETAMLDTDGLSEEEAEKRSVYFQALRTVSHFQLCMQN